MVPKTHLAGHILADVGLVLVALILVALGCTLMFYTLRPLFKKKFAPEPLPQFPGSNIQTFYTDHPTSKGAYLVGMGIFLIWGLFFGFLTCWGLFDLMNCYVLRLDTTCDASTIGLTFVFIVCTLLPMAGIWQMRQIFKKPVFCVSEEGLLYQGEFIPWNNVKRVVCIKNPTRYRGTYLELLHAKETKLKWLLRPQSERELTRYYMLSLPSRETFKQALRAYVPVEEK